MALETKTDNIELANKGLRILRKYLADFILREMISEYTVQYWWEQARDALGGNARDLPGYGEPSELANSLDTANCLRLIQNRWDSLFSKKMSRDHLTWSKELMGIRNKVAHEGGKDFDVNYTWRALDTMARFCEPCSAEGAAELNAMIQEFLANNILTQPKRPAGGILTEQAMNLPSWRNVMHPQLDVAEGRYKTAEFAADLAQVAQGRGELEYRDPVEFFRRTYMTEGITQLLTQAVKRVSARGGDPVIQLKTAFGGGKTHSLLALYHIMKSAEQAYRIPDLKNVLQGVGVTALPKVNVAVLVGTALNPATYRLPSELPGCRVNTLWGEMTAQLAISAGKPEVYNLIRESDKKGTAPGSDALRRVFDECGACLVLMDELVAYARKLQGDQKLPAGTHGNFISFVQEITEAAKASEKSLVVASIPQSAAETVDDAGKKALEAIEHTFGRMEAVWKPVSATEGFEIVRRRLFDGCASPNDRERVCEAFSQMYQKGGTQFPQEAKELDYKKRLMQCYPIHPEVFDRLYTDWATLENFQKTRGVLRLMAAVIHELWMGNDAGAMIMPGSFPLGVPAVRDELTRYLDESWNPIVDKEVDGTESAPYQKDRSAYYGKHIAARRVARTILLGSAPTAGQSNRGIDASKVRLGVVQPGESVSEFDDARNALRDSLAYLYADQTGSRFWYDTKPSLRKTAEDRASQFANDAVDDEILRRLKRLQKEAPFAGLHVCPASSQDVSDDMAVRLVVLKPSQAYSSTDRTAGTALKAAEDILNYRGAAPRGHKNMLVFAAPDMDALAGLRTVARRYLAWKSISDDQESLNLDKVQVRETKSNVERYDVNARRLTGETWRWLLVPSSDRDDQKKTKWKACDMGVSTESLASRAASCMKQDESLITNWAPGVMLMELDNLRWKDKDHVPVRELWNWLCDYLYLPRLAGREVLDAAIRTGLPSGEYFALAEGFTDGRYVGLTFKKSTGAVSPSALLVKRKAAMKQLDDEEKARKKAEEKARKEAEQNQKHGEVSPTQGTPAASGTVPAQKDGGMRAATPDPHQPAPQPKKTSFHMTKTLNSARLNRDVSELWEEVITHLTNSPGVKIEIRLDISAETADGFPAETERTVNENCNTLKADHFEFETD